MRASERVYATLRADIIDWHLEPGAMLAEVEVSERLGVSRTPVREALARLLADGLVVAHGGRGVVVAPVSMHQIAQLFDLRQSLEQQLARLASRAPSRTAFDDLARELHDAPALIEQGDLVSYYDLVARLDEAMDAAADNPYVVSAVRSMRPHLARARRISQDNPARLRAAAREHALIAEAIAAGDGELAASATHIHLDQSLKSILASSHEVQESPKGTP